MTTINRGMLLLHGVAPVSWAQAGTGRGIILIHGATATLAATGGPGHHGDRLAYGLQFPDDTIGVVAVSPIALPELKLEHLIFGPRGLMGNELFNTGLNASLDCAAAALGLAGAGRSLAIATEPGQFAPSAPLVTSRTG